jgi:hypothetical protein
MRDRRRNFAPGAHILESGQFAEGSAGVTDGPTVWDEVRGPGAPASWWRWAADGREPSGTPCLPDAAAGVLVAQGRVLEAVADGAELRGTPVRLARRLGVGAADLAAAVREAEGVGWLAVERGPGRHLAVRWADEPR